MKSARTMALLRGREWEEWAPILNTLTPPDNAAGTTATGTPTLLPLRPELTIAIDGLASADRDLRHQPERKHIEMASPDVLQELDEMIRERSILQHPFYQAWEMGALSREQLATYARIYYPHVAAFPGYLESAISLSEDPAIRAELVDNLEDELGNPAPHDELWLAFAAGLGVDRELVTSAAPHPAAQAMVTTFQQLAEQSLATGLAALYAYESQQPSVSCTKIAGLRSHYGIEDSGTLEYFEVHEAADIRHRQGERDALAACLQAGVPVGVLKDATREALDAYWGLLDGVCAEAGIEA
jgi:pyrroloquinoline-quinone synthase